MPPSDDFTVQVHRGAGVAVVSPRGEIDVATVEHVRRQLRSAEEGAGVVALDLREVAFMDTSGLQLVFEAQRRAAQASFEFAVVRGTREVQRLFEIAGLGDRLRVVDDPGELA